MSGYSTVVRATHLVTNAAWFGGSLMGAVALNPASHEGDGSRQQADIADAGWSRWGVVQGAAIGAHLLTGLAIVGDNRHRIVKHRPTTVAVVAKTTLTGAALLATGAAYQLGAELGEAKERAAQDPAAAKKARSLARTMRWLQWATPATTAGILVLDAYLGEQQRGVAGLLDRPTSMRAMLGMAG